MAARKAIDPASNVTFPDSACINTPPEFEGRTLSEFERELTMAGEADPDAVTRFGYVTSGDDLWRGWSCLSTHCLASDRPPDDPDPYEVQADCSGAQRCVDEICVD